MTPAQQPWPAPQTLLLPADRRAAARDEAARLPSWDLQPWQLPELELLLSGALQPLSGYLGEADFDAVLDGDCLEDGRPMPWPVSLDVSPEFADGVAIGDSIALRDPEGLLVALLDVSDRWQPDPERLAAALDPGSIPLRDWLQDACGAIRLGGRLRGIDLPCHYDFISLRATPVEVRDRLKRRAWRRVLGVMTARPIGPGEHALITRRARELEGNLLLLPEGVATEPGDIRYYARLRALEHSLGRFPEQTTELALAPLPPSFGTPAELRLRQLVARNYGATHLLILDSTTDHGEDPFTEHLGLTPVPATEMRYLTGRGRYCSVDEVPQGEAAAPCGVDEMLGRLAMAERIPEWLGWPEQVEALERAWPPRSAQGFTLFLTGLSGSGKSTIARALLGKLMEQGSRRVTLLDGDIVRKNLSSELGFSREDRDLNILRIGFVAAEITKNGGVAICAPIAPYAATRRRVRSTIEAAGGFVEIHVATPLEVCEARDRKGLYARARAGLIKEFTGISDPYEVPEAPELEVDTSAISPDQAAHQVLLKLAALGYI